MDNATKFRLLTFFTLLVAAQTCKKKSNNNEIAERTSNERVIPGSSPFIDFDMQKQIARGVCKISLKGDDQWEQIHASGFFCRLPLLNDEVAGLMTNAHVINENDLEDPDFRIRIYCEDVDFHVVLEPENITRWFSSEILDATFIELKQTMLYRLIDKGVRWLELSRNPPQRNQGVMIMQYPNGGKLKVASAYVIVIRNHEFNHTVSTHYGSSGSPVIELNGYKAVGIHKSKSLDDEQELYNLATSMTSIIEAVSKEFINTSFRQKLTTVSTVPPVTLPTLCQGNDPYSGKCGCAADCSIGQCCSKHGYCGSGSEYCNTNSISTPPSQPAPYGGLQGYLLTSGGLYSGSGNGTYYYDVNGETCNAYSQLYTNGYPSCTSWNVTPKTLQQYDSNNIVAIDNTLLDGSGRAKFCGKQIHIYKNGVEVQGGPFVVFDGCQTCIGGGRIDLSITVLRSIEPNACSIGVVPGISWQVSENQIIPFIP